MTRSRCHHRSTSACSAAASVLLLALLGAAVAAADEEPSPQDSACVEETCGTQCQRALDSARRHSAKYLREKVALADGFLPDPVCVGIPGVGAMGYHYVNPERMMDVEVDPRSPEILLYGERPNGRRVLVAVEYFAPVLSNGQPWFGGATEPPPSIDNPAPLLFGRKFDGPMPGHNPSMPWHYDLHVWIWQHNPAGLLAPFNPRLACP